jgi:hypothetical protein
LAKNIEITVVGANFVVGALGFVPLIEDGIDDVLPSVQTKAAWPLVRLTAGVALDLQLHLPIIADRIRSNAGELPVRPEQAPLLPLGHSDDFMRSQAWPIAPVAEKQQVVGGEVQ